MISKDKNPVLGKRYFIKKGEKSRLKEWRTGPAKLFSPKMYRDSAYT